MTSNNDKIPSKTKTSSKTTTNTNNQKISTNKFLEFLKITCQVNNSIMCSENGQEIDYDQLAENEMINILMGNQFKDGTNVSNERRSSTQLQQQLATKLNKTKLESFKEIHPILSDKLDEVFSEGILDSVIPFVCPSHPLSLLNPSYSIQMNGGIGSKTNGAKQKNNLNRDSSPTTNRQPVVVSFTSSPMPSSSQGSSTDKGSKPNDNESVLSSRLSDGSSKIKDNRGSRKSFSSSYSHHTDDKNSERTEVIIRVCDEVKNTSKDFTCPQDLLVSKMGYFADVTAGQKLEDMDISVHCDIQIFDWLMKWVKKEDSVGQTVSDNLPELDATNVVPILVSASFLQMEPLLLDCLSFCHARLNDVVRSSTNLSCLNDGIITRLAAMFTNLELEMVKDKKERIIPRLWTKLITSLWEPEPQALRGHYFSLGGIFRCSKCGKYLTQSVSSYVTCISSNMRLNRWGQLVSQHTRDTSWDITNYVAGLFKDLKTWRKVYWKLWGHCHFLYCCICETHFPAYQMNWCQFHPEPPQFLGPASEGLPAGPTGRYSCCGQQAFRYETLPGPNGCQFREHSVLVETDRDRAILTLSQIVAEGGCLLEAPPVSKTTSQNISNVIYEPRWSGLCLMPTKCRQGLLPVLNVEEYHAKLSRRIRQGTACFNDSSSETESSDTFTDGSRKFTNRQFSTTSSEGCESETSSPRNYRSNGRRRMKTSGRYWCGEFSARSNQDNQREFEERIMKQVVGMVGKKLGNEIKVKDQNLQNGGSYIRLEAEWKDHIKLKAIKSKLK